MNLGHHTGLLDHLCSNVAASDGDILAVALRIGPECHQLGFDTARTLRLSAGLAAVGLSPDKAEAAMEIAAG